MEAMAKSMGSRTPSEPVWSAAGYVAGCGIQFAKVHPLSVEQGATTWSGDVFEFISVKAEHVYAWRVDRSARAMAIVRRHPEQKPCDAVRLWLAERERSGAAQA